MYVTMCLHNVSLEDGVELAEAAAKNSRVAGKKSAFLLGNGCPVCATRCSPRSSIKNVRHMEGHVLWFNARLSQ